MENRAVLPGPFANSEKLHSQRFKPFEQIFAALQLAAAALGVMGEAFASEARLALKPTLNYLWVVLMLE
jgi:hypothetical protein